MVNYKNGKIYKIISNTDSDKCYVGSTTKQYLSQRFMQHKASYKSYKDGKYNKITSFDLFDEFGIDNCIIVLLELYPCDSKDELHSRERHYIESMNCVNIIVVGRTPKEYLQKNKDLIKSKRKQFYEENKERVIEKQKEFYNTNKDKVIDYQKVYRQENKEKIAEKKKMIYNCECGSSCRNGEKVRHYKSLKHQNFLLTLNN